MSVLVTWNGLPSAHVSTSCNVLFVSRRRSTTLPPRTGKMPFAVATVSAAPMAVSARARVRRVSARTPTADARRRSVPNPKNPETLFATNHGRHVVPRAEFVEIDAESSDAPGGVAEGRFGPDAILLVGFTADETKLWRKELDTIEASFVRLVTCGDDLIVKSLGQALETEQDDASTVQSVGGIPDRVMFFSGMVGGEIMQLVDLFNTMNIPPSIFACAVPNNWDSKVEDLVDEIADDHRVMMEREANGENVMESVNKE